MTDEGDASQAGRSRAPDDADEAAEEETPAEGSEGGSVDPEAETGAQTGSETGAGEGEAASPDPDRRPATDATDGPTSASDPGSPADREREGDPDSRRDLEGEAGEEPSTVDTPESDDGDDPGSGTDPDPEEGNDPATDAVPDPDNGEDPPVSAVPDPDDVPPDVRKYDRFKKIDGSTYDRANEFLRDRTYITAREWAIARLCADFRTETGVEMTKIGENLPHLVPFMTDTYTPQAVNQARHAFEEKVRKAGATFLYGAMCDFFTAEELDDVMYEATEVAKFLLEVEGVDLAVEEELAAEDRISSVMREVRESSAALRHDEVHCPECGHSFDADGAHRDAADEGTADAQE